VRVSIGIFAHNDGATVDAAIQSFLNQVIVRAAIAEVVVVCCACVDETTQAVERHVAKDCRVRMIERPIREGKVAAINDFLAVASSEYIILSGADVIAGPHLVELLVRAIAEHPTVAMAGPRISTATRHEARLTGKLHAVLWKLHDHVARHHPKLGEAVAVRRSVLPARLPDGVHCDEVLIEYLTISRGLRLSYVPEAEVINFPPANLRDLFQQRRRVACQHRAARELLGYAPATTKIGNIAMALAATWYEEPRSLPWLLVMSLVESLAHAWGFIDGLRGRQYATWAPARRDVRHLLQPKSPLPRAPAAEPLRLESNMAQRSPHPPSQRTLPDWRV
jgi:hypothetical protein